MSALTPELRAWLKPGVAGVVTVADDDGQPEIVRFWAVRPLDDSDVVEVFLQRATAARLLEVLADGRRAALNAVEVSSYRSRLLKGFCTRLTGDVDQAFATESIAAQSRAFASVGMPADAARRILSHGEQSSLVGLRIEVDCVFDQSPKPGAGAPL
jgi:hypothetical protein